MHISITGDLGSGKSTVAKEICRILGLNYLSTGLIQRRLGQEKGMDTLEFNKFANNNKEVDEYIDQQLKDVNDKTESYVLDSRLGWHFVNKSFKIYAMAIDEVAATRVLMDGVRIGEPSSGDLQTKIKQQKERRTIENERFEKIYGIKPSIFKDFDAIIDTSTATIEEVTSLLIELYQKHINNEPFAKIWLSPKRIFPTNNAVVAAEDIYFNNEESALKEDEKPIRCVLYNREFYLFDGHRRLSAALKTDIPFVPVILLAKDAEIVQDEKSVIAFIQDNFDKKFINEWEIAHGFKFFHYPTGDE
ncbi:MAG: (d)CMP kinase, partial [Spirosomaceae bacterium]|nr:(d)CMP kinase [Spirosomataceae bacterium]